jgi:hypothetical protein
MVPSDDPETRTLSTPFTRVQRRFTGSSRSLVMFKEQQRA